LIERLRMTRPVHVDRAASVINNCRAVNDLSRPDILKVHAIDGVPGNATLEDAGELLLWLKSRGRLN
jgi:hypothetical protein